MTDRQQPSFLGGMPPRSGLAAAQPVADRAPVDAREREPLNRLSVVAFAVSFIVGIAGVVLALVALRQLRDSDDRGRGLALSGLFIGLVGVAVSVALFAVFLLGGPGLVAGLTGVGNSAQAPSALPPTQKISAAEAAAAKAAIASGGGALPGHIVSGELCKALGAFEATSAGKSTVSDVDPAVLSAMQALAAVKSPNQDSYARAATLAKDPAAVKSIVEAQEITADFAKAVQVDLTTCP